MPAIDAAMPPTPSPSSAPTESRPAGSAGVNTGKINEIEPGASDAFIAALLAQSTLPAAMPDVALAVAEGGPLPAAGQELPTLRPALATQAGARRAPLPAATDGLAAVLTSDTPTVEGGADEFATAFVALQDAMTGGGERGAPLAAEADAAAAQSGNGLLADLSAATAGATSRGDSTPSQALDALTGAQGARAQETSAPAQSYAAKPAPLPVNEPALFSQRLNQHISFMISDQVQSAQIAVTPADLGPVEVRVTMVGDEAKIQLSATHAATREALNEALPRLRASFAEAGIALSQAGVFAQMPERQQPDPSLGGQARASEHDFEPAPSAARSTARNLRVGLIDAFV
jgi:flagellar hook-length control protein FliK